jgi:hypothetical protein
MGKKTSKDVSICLKTFQKITSEQWVQMCELEGETTGEKVKMTPEELRAARVARFTSV